MGSCSIQGNSAQNILVAAFLQERLARQTILARIAARHHEVLKKEQESIAKSALAMLKTNNNGQMEVHTLTRDNEIKKTQIVSLLFQEKASLRFGSSLFRYLW